MLQPAAILLLAGLLVAGAHGSAIKGHPSVPAESVRSVKSLASSEQVQRLAAPVKQQQQQQLSASSGPAILESSRKVYNDESIRRSAVKAAPSPVEVPVAAPVAAPVQPAPSAPVNEPVVSAANPQQPVAAPVAAPVAVPVAAPVVAPVAAPVTAPVEAKVEAKSAEPKAELKPERKPVDPVVKAAAPSEQPADSLPPQSDRSAPIKEPAAEAPVVPVVPVVPVAPVAPVAPIVPIVPVVAVEQQQAPVIEQKQPVASVVQPAASEESPLQAKKDDSVAVVPKESGVVNSEPALNVEVPPPDPGLVLSEPIDSTTKLLIDLDEHVQKFLPAEDKQEPSQPAKDQVLINGVDYSPAGSAAEPSGKSALPVPYSFSPGADPNEPIVPPMPSLEGVEKASAASGSGAASAANSAAASRQASSSSSSSGHGHGQNQQQVITQLLDQLDSLQNRIQDTINQLVARRRYVMSALLRPMGTYVRRVRTNLERLQTRVNSLQAAAQSVGGSNNGQRPGGFVDAAAIETIRRRIDDISKRISDIVNRIRFSLTPTSAPMNSNGRK